jgi:hypothetical protein
MGRIRRTIINGSGDHAPHHPNRCFARLPTDTGFPNWRFVSNRRSGSSSAQKYKISVIGGLRFVRYSQSS